MSMGAIFFSWRNRHTFVSSILTYQMPFFRLPLCCHLQHGNKNLLNIDGKVQPLLSYHQHPSLTLWTNNNKTGVVTFGTVHQCLYIHTHPVMYTCYILQHNQRASCFFPATRRASVVECD